MDTLHPSFIRGFTEKCASAGLGPDEIAQHIERLQTIEQLSDPDVHDGFMRKASAAGLMDWLSKLDPKVKASLIGAGVGGAGGLIFGGKNRIRNGLLGAAGGAAAGYGVGAYRQHLKTKAPAAAPAPTGEKATDQMLQSLGLSSISRAKDPSFWPGKGEQRAPLVLAPSAMS